jgi:hypothetical protein
MANVRAFNKLDENGNPFVLNLSASDLAQRRRNKTIYNEIKQNVETLNTNNPQKTNGYKYSTVKTNITCDISGGHIDYVDNYELKTSISNGRDLINAKCVS